MFSRTRFYIPSIGHSIFVIRRARLLSAAVQAVSHCGILVVLGCSSVKILDKEAIATSDVRNVIQCTSIRIGERGILSMGFGAEVSSSSTRLTVRESYFPYQLFTQDFERFEKNFSQSVNKLSAGKVSYRSCNPQESPQTPASLSLVFALESVGGDIDSTGKMRTRLYHSLTIKDNGGHVLFATKNTQGCSIFTREYKPNFYGDDPYNFNIGQISKDAFAAKVLAEISQCFHDDISLFFHETADIYKL